MKILKIFGAVVGVHLVAFMLIFANPGCTSTAKQPTAPVTAEATGPSPTITVPATETSSATVANDPSISLGTSAPAISTPRYSPTRPGTPAATAVQAQPVADVTPATTYTVVNGDTLSGIAKKNHITTKELSAANKLKSESKLKLGQKLIIPGKSAIAAPVMTAASTKQPETMAATPVADASPKASGNGAPLTHVVKAGESLALIAKKYQVKSSEIAVANNITNPALIRAGMTLTIPGGWQAPKSGKASGSTSAPAAEVAQPTPTPITPPPGQDLDAGLRPSQTTEIPVIRVDDSQTSPAPKSP